MFLIALLMSDFLIIFSSFYFSNSQAGQTLDNNTDESLDHHDLYSGSFYTDYDSTHSNSFTDDSYYDSSNFDNSFHDEIADPSYCYLP